MDKSDPPIRQDPDSFAPLDEGDFDSPFDEFDDDYGDDYEGVGGRGGLLRIVAVVAVLAGLIAVLVWSPFSIIDRGGDDPADVGAAARGELPDVPDGLSARSKLYDLAGDGAINGPAELTVLLSEPVGASEQLGFYTYVGRRVALPRGRQRGRGRRRGAGRGPGRAEEHRRPRRDHDRAHDRADRRGRRGPRPGRAARAGNRRRACRRTGGGRGRGAGARRPEPARWTRRSPKPARRASTSA